jgi:hypothetical protein
VLLLHVYVQRVLLLRVCCVPVFQSLRYVLCTSPLVSHLVTAFSRAHCHCTHTLSNTHNPPLLAHTELDLVPPHLLEAHPDLPAVCIATVQLEQTGKVAVAYTGVNPFCQMWAQHLRAGVAQTVADPFQQRNRSLFFKEKLIKDLNDTRRAAYQSITNHYSLHRVSFLCDCVVCVCVCVWMCVCVCVCVWVGV